MKSHINIYGRKTTEHVIECLARINQGAETINLRAFGGNVQKGIELAQMLTNELSAKVVNTEIKSYKIDGISIPCLGIEIKVGESDYIQDHFKAGKVRTKFLGGRTDFINYSTYSLLADWSLNQSGSMNIYDRKGNTTPLLRIQKANGGGRKKIKLHPKLLDMLKNSNVDPGTMDRLSASLKRAGFLQPFHWKEIGKKLAEFDDVVLGLDTNMLYNCTISEHLIPIMALVQAENYSHRPNWIMLVIPRMVMHELENAANIRNEQGLLIHSSRMAYRALQEISDLKRNTDIQGLTLVIPGKALPMQGLQEDLKSIKEGIHRMSHSPRPVHKSSVGDAAIRQQFKHFLQTLDFHKGSYFLTADKSNAAMAMVESMDPIYLKYPNYRGLGARQGEIHPFKLTDDGGELDLDFDVPIGTIIYELAVSFGEIALGFGLDNENIVTLECDRWGESLQRWVHKQLLISESNLHEWIGAYGGRVDLESAFRYFKKITQRFEGEDWFFEMDSPWKLDSYSK